MSRTTSPRRGPRNDSSPARESRGGRGGAPEKERQAPRDRFGHRPGLAVADSDAEEAQGAQRDGLSDELPESRRQRDANLGVRDARTGSNEGSRRQHRQTLEVRSEPAKSDGRGADPSRGEHRRSHEVSPPLAHLHGNGPAELDEQGEPRVTRTLA